MRLIPRCALNCYKITYCPLMTFLSKIHVDRYKHSIYTHISDPFLRSIVTRDPASSRFHACERFNRCSYATQTGSPSGTVSGVCRRVVYINPVTMGNAVWDTYMRSVKAKLSDGDVVTSLVSASFLSRLFRASCRRNATSPLLFRWSDTIPRTDSVESWSLFHATLICKNSNRLSPSFAHTASFRIRLYPLFTDLIGYVWTGCSSIVYPRRRIAGSGPRSLTLAVSRTTPLTSWVRTREIRHC